MCSESNSVIYLKLLNNFITLGPHKRGSITIGIWGLKLMVC